ncbi:MAG: flavodoxin domain-containing protein [Deltaproteobacteria bacterium]
MEPLEIAPGVYDVGVSDWNIRDFHGYSTDLGTTYNAFLIVDQKIALLDTVKKVFADQLLDNISAIIDPKKIDYIISNHTELDHSGGLARVMHRVGEDKPLYCSKMGHKNLPRHFFRNWNYHPVETGQELSLGKKTLSFVETRMVHWPDSMFTYLKEDKILFSSDGFGQHFAGPERFDDQIGEAIMVHAKKYFANILLLYVPLIKKYLKNIIDAEKMAEAIAAGINKEGVPTKPLHLRKWHRSEVMTEVFDAKAIVVGGPTLNNGLFPSLADFLSYMKGLKPLNKIGAAFGSYGWSGEAVKIITAELESMKFNIIDPGLKIQYIPDKKGLEDCYAYGRKIGKAVNE